MRLKTGLAAAGLLASVAVLVPTPAQAATGYDRCPANRLCVFSGVNGSGVIGYFTTGDGNLADTSGPRGLNNNIESAWNRRAEVWCLWNDAGYQGAFGIAYGGSKGNIPAGSRNLTSSLRGCG